LARELGVSEKTIKRWEKGKKIPKAKRDYRDVRWWPESDAAVIRAWFHSEKTEEVA
jgi:transcriptional regulator with XRE-family HTH domain